MIAPRQPTQQKTFVPKIQQNNLPSAFGNKLTRSLNPEKNQLNPNRYEINNDDEDINQEKKLQDLERLLEIQQFKQAQNMLKPLSIELDHDNKKDVISSLDQVNIVNKQNSNKKKKNGKNPLQPLKRYMQNFSKVMEDTKDLPPEFCVQNIIQQNKFKLMDGNQKSLINNQIKLEEMITIGSVRGLKKMLHVPSLKLFALKEVPLNNKDNRKNLKDWIAFWQNEFKESSHHVEIYATFWNQPEGCLSIVAELMESGSLQNLLKSVGCIPESQIQKIAQQSMNALYHIQKNNQSFYGKIKLSQILLDKNGSVKLGFGVSNINHQNKYSLSQFKNSNENKISLYDSQIFNNKHIQNDQNQQIELLQQNDIYNLGIAFLTCALGSLDILEFIS